MPNRSNDSFGPRDGNAADNDVALQPGLAYERDPDLLHGGRVLLARWPLLAAAAVLGVLAGLLVAWRVPVQYQAVALLQLSRGVGQAATTSAIRALATNPTTVAKVFEELRLERPADIQSFIDASLAAQSVPGTDLMRIAVTVGDPSTAAAIARRIAQKTVELNDRVVADDARSDVDELVANKNEADDARKRAEDELVRLKNRRDFAALEQEQTNARSVRESLPELNLDIEAQSVLVSALKRQIAQLGVAPSSPGNELQYRIVIEEANLAALEEKRRRAVALASGPSEKTETALEQLRLEELRLQSEYDARVREDTEVSDRLEAARNSARARWQRVSDPVVPDRPQPRNWKQDALLGGSLGLLVGLAAAFWLGEPAGLSQR